MPGTVCELNTSLDSDGPGRGGRPTDEELAMANVWSKLGEMIIPRFPGGAANGALMRQRVQGEWTAEGGPSEKCTAQVAGVQ